MISNRLSDLMNHLKMNLLKLIVILSVLSGGYSSCKKEKDEVLYPLYDANQIIGKWRCEKEDDNISHFYSKFNIIYDFQPDGILSVTGESDIHFCGLKPGMYPYSIIDTVVITGGCYSHEGNGRYLKIDKTMHPSYSLFITKISTKNLNLIEPRFCSPPRFIFKKIN